MKDDKCIWTASIARGVYRSSCSVAGFIDVPPSPGSNCPYCGRPFEMAKPKRRTVGKTVLSGEK